MPYFSDYVSTIPENQLNNSEINEKYLEHVKTIDLFFLPGD